MVVRGGGRLPQRQTRRAGQRFPRLKTKESYSSQSSIVANIALGRNANMNIAVRRANAPAICRTVLASVEFGVNLILPNDCQPCGWGDFCLAHAPGVHS